MNIEILKMLEENPTLDGFTMEGISEAEIAQLEQLYNDGNPFPKVLKEMLFLAGDFCPVLEFCGYNSQQEMQDDVRAEFAEDGFVIDGPHYFVDLRVLDEPFFIFLDEGDDPALHQILYDDDNNEYVGEENGTLTVIIEIGIEKYLEGRNPF